MSESDAENDFFKRLAQKASFESAPRAPSRLKSRIYTRLLQHQSDTGPLMSLAEHRGGLCVFEKIVALAPVGDRVKQRNPCSICHARVLAEHLDHAPIYWRNCPYAGFHER